MQLKTLRLAHPRCELRGNYAADGWKHTTRSGHVSRSYRCPNDATWISSGGTRFCDACGNHGKVLAEAEISSAKRQLEAIRTAKRLKLKRIEQQKCKQTEGGR
jgi:radical SAM superfamily enzyme